MATFDLRLPEHREALGIDDSWDKQADGIETVSIPFQRKGSGGGAHRSRGDTERMIVEVVSAAPIPMTRLQIARAVGRAKSPYLVGLIIALVESGELTETAIRRPNGALEYQYWRG
jgi:hypothetical protein